LKRHDGCAKPLDSRKIWIRSHTEGDPCQLAALRYVGDALASWIRRAERRAGLSIIRLHILRHTFCSRLAIRGATTKAIQELAGHVSLTTT
jgi:integrase